MNVLIFLEVGVTNSGLSKYRSDFAGHIQQQLKDQYQDLGNCEETQYFQTLF